MQRARKISKKLFSVVAFVIFFGAVFLASKALAAQSQNFIADAFAGLIENLASPSYSLQVSAEEFLQGAAGSSNFILNLGALYAYGEDSPPRFFNQSQSTSTPAEGAEVRLSADFTDDVGLSTAIISANETGSFKNETLQLSGTEYKLFYTWSKQAASGTAVAWKFFVFDSAGNYNETPVLNFFVGAVDREAPKILKATGPESASAGNVVSIDVEVSDDFGLNSVIFEVNGKNVSEKILSGLSGKASYSFFADEGSTVWRAFAKDSSGKETSSEPKSFIVSKSAVVTATTSGFVGDATTTSGASSTLPTIAPPSLSTITTQPPLSFNQSALAIIILILLLLAAGCYFYRDKIKSFLKKSEN